MIVGYTKLYSHIEKVDFSFEISNKKIQFRGCHWLPDREMYCETTPDTFVQARSDSLPRDTFESILRSLYPHLCDNKQLDKQDKFSKLHPVINRWNKSIVK